MLNFRICIYKYFSKENFFVILFSVSFSFPYEEGLNSCLLCESFICRVIVTFGLNALYGRHQIRRGAWEGDWDPSNTIDLMKYTISKGYQIDSWEFGMEQ